MHGFLLYPPVTFAVAFLIIRMLSKLTGNFAPRPVKQPEGKLDAYACGEDYKAKQIEPDYGTFFPFAIFFTVIHVAGLMIATLAAASVTAAVTGFALLYVVSVGIVFAMLYAE